MRASVRRGEKLRADSHWAIRVSFVEIGDVLWEVAERRSARLEIASRVRSTDPVAGVAVLVPEPSAEGCPHMSCLNCLVA
jgi:hypothetical protein